MPLDPKAKLAENTLNLVLLEQNPACLTSRSYNNTIVV